MQLFILASRLSHMKATHLLGGLCLLVLNTGSLHAQSVFPTELVQQKWEYVTWNFWGGTCETRFVKNGDKVPLCSDDYIEVFDCDGAEIDCQLIGYYRIQNDSVMVREIEIFWDGSQWNDSVDCTKAEGLMYDFGAAELAILHCQMNYPTPNADFWKIDESMVDYAGTLRSTLSMNYLPYATFPDIINNMKWIKGIGSDVHPFYSFSCIGDHCEWEQQITRVTRDGKLIYEDTVLSFSFPCTGWVTTSVAENLTVDPLKYSISPNPVQDHVRLQPLEERFHHRINVELFDGLGKVWAQHQGVSSDFSLEMKTLPAGLYFIRISREGWEEVHKVLKK